MMTKVNEARVPGGDAPASGAGEKRPWVPPAIVEQDLLETVAGACGTSAKALGQTGCTDQSLT